MRAAGHGHPPALSTERTQGLALGPGWRGGELRSGGQELHWQSHPRTLSRAASISRRALARLRHFLPQTDSCAIQLISGFIKARKYLSRGNSLACQAFVLGLLKP